MNSSRTSTLTKQYCKAKNDCIRKMMISELQKGHRAATDLLLLPASRDSAIDLTDTIINSFSNSLSMLSDQSEPQPQPQPQLRSGDGDSNNIIIAPKSRRGCYRRRKTGQTREVVTPSFAADRYAWRKYGQKTILNSPYPRQYYRCTHKTEQGCQATKWVQRVSDHETSSILSSSLSSSAAAAAASSSSSSSSAAVALYRTLYEGEHTCKTSPPQIGSADLDNINNYILLGNSPPSTPLVVQVQVPPSSANSASDYNLYLNFGDPASTTINVPSTGTNITASTAIDTNNNNQYYHSSSGSGGGTHEDCLFFSSSSISLAGGDHHHHEMLATTTSSSINTTIHYDNIFPTINNTIGDVISAKLEPAASGSPLISNYHHAATDDYSIMAAAQISSDDYFDGIFDVDLSPL